MFKFLDYSGYSTYSKSDFSLIGYITGKISNFFIKWKEAVIITGILAYSQITVPIVNFIKGEELVMFNYTQDILRYTFMIGMFHLFQSLLYKHLPCYKTYGTVTPDGNKPEYNDNGLLAWLLTACLEVFCFSYYSIRERMLLFEDLGNFHQSLNYYGIIISLYYYITAIISEKQYLNEPFFSNNPVIDFYKGVELHSKNMFGDAKIVVNSRVGMMLWGMINILALMASDASNVSVSAYLQLIYITKFFIWEGGYVKTTDITLDRCGYYLFWGCISYVPSIYTSPTIYHYYYPNDNYTVLSALTVILGIYSIYINWEIDCERTELRERQMYIGSKHRSGYIKAEYKTSDGKTNTTYLVACGWMGIASNINYFFEIFAALMWTLGGTIPKNIFCYTYVIYLTVLLVHRTYRLERKCLEKYGASWKLYRNLVPYKIIPGFF